MIKFIDISHHNGFIDWAQMKKKGFEFTYLKATEGEHYHDPMFKKNVEGARAAGMPVGAYHFFRPQLDPLAQANHFLLTTAFLNLELPPCFDWEVSDGVRRAVQIQKATMWLDQVDQRSPKKSIIYGSPSFLQDLHLPLAFNQWKLWIAHYGVKAPRVPTPWVDWTFWQTSDAHGLDLDVFNGTLEQLKSV